MLIHAAHGLQALFPGLKAGYIMIYEASRCMQIFWQLIIIIFLQFNYRRKGDLISECLN
jgi:hypothetical protein